MQYSTQLKSASHDHVHSRFISKRTKEQNNGWLFGINIAIHFQTEYIPYLALSLYD